MPSQDAACAHVLAWTPDPRSTSMVHSPSRSSPGKAVLGTPWITVLVPLNAVEHHSSVPANGLVPAVPRSLLWTAESLGSTTPLPLDTRLSFDMSQHRKVTDETTCFGLFHAALEIVEQTALTANPSQSGARVQPLILDGLPVLVDYYIKWIGLREAALPAAEALWSRAHALPTKDFKVRFRYRHQPLATIGEPKLWEVGKYENNVYYTRSMLQQRFLHDVIPMEADAIRLQHYRRDATALPDNVSDKIRIFVKASPLPPFPSPGREPRSLDIGLTRTRESWAQGAIGDYASQGAAHGIHSLVAEAVTALVRDAPRYSVLSLACVLLEALHRLNSPRERPEDWYLLRTAGSLHLEAQGSSHRSFWIQEDDWKHCARRLFAKHDFAQVVDRVGVERAMTQRVSEPYHRAQADAKAMGSNAEALYPKYKEVFRLYRRLLEDTLQDWESTGLDSMQSLSLAVPSASRGSSSEPLSRRRSHSASHAADGSDPPHPGVEVTQYMGRQTTDWELEEAHRRQQEMAEARRRSSAVASSSGSSHTVSRKASIISAFLPGSRSGSPELRRSSRPNILRTASSTLFAPHSRGGSQRTSPASSRRPSLAPTFVANVFGRNRDDDEGVTATSDSEDDIDPTDKRSRQRGRQ